MSSISSAVCLAGSLLLAQADEKVLHTAPAIQVKNQPAYGADSANGVRVNMLLYYQIHWGFNYRKPDEAIDRGDPEKDFSRLPTTYWHRKGPLGVAMEKFNWFPGPANTFHSDARIVASLVGQGPQLGGQLTALWSEPPIAVLGMNIGTEAAYARPLQSMHFVERNRDLIALSAPAKGDAAFFDYIEDARARGAGIKVLPGEHRATFARRGGASYYHLIVVETIKDSKHEHLHADLLTREGMQMLMDKLAEEGLLCYHTSHRHVDVAKLVASVAKDCGYACRQGTDSGRWDKKERGYFSSQWVMVARKAEYLKHLKEPEGYLAPGQYWSEPVASDRYVWKDGQRNTLAGLWRSNPYIADLGNIVRDMQYTLSRSIGFQQFQAIFQPLYDRIDALDRLVVSVQNR